MKQYLVSVESVTKTIYRVSASSPDEALSKYEIEGGDFVEEEIPNQDESMGTVIGV